MPSTVPWSLPRTVRLLRELVALESDPDAYLFTTTEGLPIEPKSFSVHWYRCLRELGIRVRGLYATKDTYVSLAMSKGVVPAFLEQHR